MTPPDYVSRILQTIQISVQCNRRRTGADFTGESGRQTHRFPCPFNRRHRLSCQRRRADVVSGRRWLPVDETEECRVPLPSIMLIRTNDQLRLEAPQKMVNGQMGSRRQQPKYNEPYSSISCRHSGMEVTTMSHQWTASMRTCCQRCIQSRSWYIFIYVYIYEQCFTNISK